MDDTAASFCRPIPKALRDLLLGVFSQGNRDHALFSVGERYAQWGAQRVIRGEAQPFPLLRSRRGDLDPFEVFTAAIEDQRNHNHSVDMTLLVDGKRVEIHDHWFSVLDDPQPADLSKRLMPSSMMVKRLAALYGTEDRTIVSSIERAVSWWLGNGWLFQIYLQVVLFNPPSHETAVFPPLP